MNENYNPVERRSKGGKDRNPKGSQKTTKSLQASNLHNPASGPKLAKAFAVAGGANSSVDIQALLKEITDLKLSVDVLEKERDFYFAKLRDVEILCQTHEFEDFPMTVAVKKILYAADANESALAEAQQYLAQSLNTDENRMMQSSCPSTQLLEIFLYSPHNGCSYGSNHRGVMDYQ